MGKSNRTRKSSKVTILDGSEWVTISAARAEALVNAGVLEFPRNVGADEDADGPVYVFVAGEDWTDVERALGLGGSWCTARRARGAAELDESASRLFRHGTASRRAERPARCGGTGTD